jgi:hypothetical protein
VVIQRAISFEKPFSRRLSENALKDGRGKGTVDKCRINFLLERRNIVRTFITGISCISASLKAIKFTNESRIHTWVVKEGV